MAKVQEKPVSEIISGSVEKTGTDTETKNEQQKKTKRVYVVVSGNVLTKQEAQEWDPT
jgi:hypothetical protein